ncbi:MAG TPA: adenylate/guanylate cyclase domain-containing protein, partial [Candidatus Didemnitutus sp.]|nr:adenylate/guanylate cyclase domain-containing protein [Candidatus Didemnitutus sp.]
MQGESRDTSVRQERRLAAIVFTDVVSYSARMGRDESGTLALVRADFDTMRARCSAHRGEVLNTMGDGMLMCFPSAVEAVTCALELQKAFGLRAEAEPPEKALLHRIGIHVGDVFFEGGNVSGDGVNIAARLESKAPHGGICASQIVHDTVKGKLDMWSVALGEQKFKNISEPIAVFSIAPPGMGVDTRPPTPPVKEVESGLRWRLAAVIIVLVLAGVFALRYKPVPPEVKPVAKPLVAPAQAVVEKPAPPSTPGQRLAAQAQALCRKPSFTREELSLAGDLALKASDLEPDRAFAWGTRAEISASYIYRGWDVDHTRARDAEAWARRAMALDAKEPGALFALGVIARV